VREAFEAFDARDAATIEELIAPSARIVHHNGVITGLPTMLTIMRETARWAPRTRELSDFVVTEMGGDNLLVTCRNHIVTDPGTLQEASQTYTETWLLESIGGKLRAVHVHYSAVTAPEHSEGPAP
jgi:Domain of unknown function (DUF4440)